MRRFNKNAACALVCRHRRRRWFFFLLTHITHNNKLQTHYHMSVCSRVRPRDWLAITQSILLSSSKLQDANDIIIYVHNICLCMYIRIVYNRIHAEECIRDVVWCVEKWIWSTCHRFIIFLINSPDWRPSYRLPLTYYPDRLHAHSFWQTCLYYIINNNHVYVQSRRRFIICRLK